MEFVRHEPYSLPVIRGLAATGRLDRDWRRRRTKHGVVRLRNFRVAHHARPLYTDLLESEFFVLIFDAEKNATLTSAEHELGIT